METIREDYYDAYHKGGGYFWQVFIYQILNKANGKKWVSETFNLDVSKFGQFYMLKKGTHPSKEFIKDYNTYGENAFEFSVLDVHNDINTLPKKYKDYIEFIKPEYNLQKNY